MSLIPVFLTDDAGDQIVDGSGDFIIVGYVQQDLFSGLSGELSTSFLSLVQNATTEQKQEVLNGLRLARPIRGMLGSFTLGGEVNNAYVRYNRQIFGGRFQSQYTALGAIAGTYLRKSGSAFTKEIIEAALVAGPSAQYTYSGTTLGATTATSIIPDTYTFDASETSGTATFAWTITDTVTTFSPTTKTTTALNLTAGTWTVDLAVTDNAETTNAVQRTLNVAELATTGITASVDPPVVGQNVTYTVGANDTDLIDSSAWTFKMDLTVADIDLVAGGEDYTVVSSTANSITVQFHVTGAFVVGCTATEIGGQVQTAETPFTVTDLPSTASYTNHAYLQAGSTTCDALYKGDTHCIVVGDSLMNLMKGDSFRKGMQFAWNPARWSGLQPPLTTNETYLTGTEAAWYSCFHSNWDNGGTNYILNRSDEHSVARTAGTTNTRRDGTKDFSGTDEPYMDATVAVKRTAPANVNQFKVTATSGTDAWSTELVNSGRVATPMLGRLQYEDNAFYNTNGMLSRAIGFGVDAMTMDLTSDVGSAAASTVTFTAGSHVHMQTICDTLESNTGSNFDTLLLSLDGTESTGDRFAMMDQFVYNPNTPGLSISYLGDGGWQSANHRGGARSQAAGKSTTVNGGEYYDDDAIKEHLEMVVWQNSAKNVLRDNIVCMIEVQNRIAAEGHDGTAKTDVVALIERWKTQAELVSTGLGDAIKFVFLVLIDNPSTNEHEETATMLLDVVDRTDYDFEVFNLNAAIKALGVDYETPANYDFGGSLTPDWYDSGDQVHPNEAGNNDIMGVLWDDIIVANATAQVPFTITVNGPASGDDADTYTYTAAVATGTYPTDRLIKWDVTGDLTVTEYGESYTLPSTVGSYTVTATVYGADGASATDNQAVTISATNPAITGSVVVGGTLEDGQVLTLDLNGISDEVQGEGSLTATWEYSFNSGAWTAVDTPGAGTVSSGAAAQGSHTVSTGDYVFRCTITDGTGGTNSASSTTQTVVASETLEGIIPFGDNGDNTNENATSTALDDYFDAMQTTPGTGALLHYTVTTPGASGVRFLINTNGSFSELSCMTEFASRINTPQTVEMRFKTGASTYYKPNTATLQTSLETSTNLDLSDWVDETDTTVAASTVATAIDGFINLEIWTV